jgi:hypothetical protein
LCVPHAYFFGEGNIMLDVQQVIDTINSKVSLTDAERSHVKIIGSSLIKSDYNDIDIFTDDQWLFSKLLFIGGGLHPTLIKPILFPDVHQISSFYNFCLSADMDGTIRKSEHFVEGNELEFNISSVIYFRDPKTIKKHLKKLLERGYTIDETQRAKMSIVINPPKFTWQPNKFFI